MKENKFLKNLNQPVTPMPTPTPGLTDPHSLVSSVEPSDPIQRLTQALTRHSQAMEGLSSRLDRLEQRPAAATQAEVAALLVAAQAGVTVKADSGAIAQLMVPALKQGIEDATTKAVSAIQGASNQAAGRIEGSSQQRADRWANAVGFLNWRSGLVLGLFPLVLIGLSLYELASSRQQASTAQAELSQLQVDNREWVAFGKWVRVHFPAHWKTYTDPAYVPQNGYLKKVKPKP